MKEITAKWLEDRGACKTKLKRFRLLFGDQTKVNYENAEIWRENSRYWKQDFEWLFSVVYFRIGGHGSRVIKELCNHLFKIYNPRQSTDSEHKRMWFTEIIDTLFKLKNHRIIWGMTQFIYVVPNEST